MWITHLTGVGKKRKPDEEDPSSVPECARRNESVTECSPSLVYRCIGRCSVQFHSTSALTPGSSLLFVQLFTIVVDAQLDRCCVIGVCMFCATRTQDPAPPSASLERRKITLVNPTDFACCLFGTPLRGRSCYGVSSETLLLLFHRVISIM